MDSILPQFHAAPARGQAIDDAILGRDDARRHERRVRKILPILPICRGQATKK